MKQTQAIAVYTILAAHCARGPEGMAVYEPGWDDARVVEQSNAANRYPDRPISLASVQSLRLHEFGRVRSPTRPVETMGPGDPSINEIRLVALEERVSILEHWMGLRSTKPNGE
jgi:hypothetical protein